MRFNINDYVWVKLTERGRKRYDETHSPCLKPELHEKNGYARFQLWDLMAIFGPCMFNGAELVIETEILINEEPPEDKIVSALDQQDVS